MKAAMDELISNIVPSKYTAPPFALTAVLLVKINDEFSKDIVEALEYRLAPSCAIFDAKFAVAALNNMVEPITKIAPPFPPIAVLDVNLIIVELIKISEPLIYKAAPESSAVFDENRMFEFLKDAVELPIYIPAALAKYVSVESSTINSPPFITPKELIFVK
jgi:hypothetical protein